MHVRYIVYCPKNSTPKVDIWKTEGDLTYPVYAEEHGIRPCDISSMGYLLFNPHKQKWELKHWHMTDGIPSLSLSEIIKQHKRQKRDKILVQKKIHETDFLSDEQIKQQCHKISFFRRCIQND